MASQQQHFPQRSAAPHAGPPGECRTPLPPPANDNHAPAAGRRFLVIAAAAIALVLAVMALQPFG